MYHKFPSLFISIYWHLNTLIYRILFIQQHYVTLLLNNDVVTSAREDTENCCASSYLQFIWKSMHSDISTITSARANIYGSCVKFRFSFYLTVHQPPIPALRYPRQIYKRLNFYLAIDLKCESH